MIFTYYGVVFLGGGVGAMARLALSSFVARYMGTNFPWGTLAVNLTGAFIMGIIVEFLALKGGISPQARAFLVTGVLGGFTTFSAFSLEAYMILEKAQYISLAFYIGASVFGTIAAIVAGMFLIRLL